MLEFRFCPKAEEKWFGEVPRAGVVVELGAEDPSLVPVMAAVEDPVIRCVGGVGAMGARGGD